MARPSPNLLFEFGKALRSTLGWVGVVGATMFAGIFSGMWIGLGELPSLYGALCVFTGSLVAWLLFPWILAAFLVTWLALYVPLKVESTWLYLGAALVNLVTWTVATAWVLG